MLYLSLGDHFNALMDFLNARKVSAQCMLYMYFIIKFLLVIESGSFAVSSNSILSPQVRGEREGEGGKSKG